MCPACEKGIFNIDEQISLACGCLIHKKCGKLLKLDALKIKICPRCIAKLKKDYGAP